MHKQSMVMAVELARKMEGDWVARMKMALKMAWAIIKKKKEEKQVKLSKFDQFRFEGLKVRDRSNKYYELNRVSGEGAKIIVKVDDSHLLKTRYGYALILDDRHVVFVKDWQVEQNFYGNEVLLNKEYFNVKKWGQHEDFSPNSENHKWETWVRIARKQEAAGNKVRWKK